MNPEQFNQIVDAILEGKYSWACVLILRSAGYNPLQYIPYRTYNRLLKENCQFGKSSRNKSDTINAAHQNATTKSDGSASQKCLSQITDIDYLEEIDQPKIQGMGGNIIHWLGLAHQENSSSTFDFVPPKNKWFSIFN